MNSRIRHLALAMIILYVILFVQLNVIQVGRKNTLDSDTRNTRQEWFAPNPWCSVH